MLFHILHLQQVLYFFFSITHRLKRVIKEVKNNFELNLNSSSICHNLFARTEQHIINHSSSKILVSIVIISFSPTITSRNEKNTYFILCDTGSPFRINTKNLKTFIQLHHVPISSFFMVLSLFPTI